MLAGGPVHATLKHPVSGNRLNTGLPAGKVKHCTIGRKLNDGGTPGLPQAPSGMFLEGSLRGKTRTSMEEVIQNGEPVYPPLRVMVVEDRPDVAEGLEMLLVHLGHTVEVAHKAHEALQSGPDFKPDVILLDIGLPDLSGYDVCKEIRASSWGLNKFVVAVTGRDEPSDVIRTAHTGFDRHVAKPMALDTLKDILHTVQKRVVLTNPYLAPE